MKKLTIPKKPGIIALLTVYFLLGNWNAKGQALQIILNPFTPGFTIDQIWQTSIINPTRQNYRVYFEYEISTGSTGGLICKVITSSFNLPPGTTSLTEETGLKNQVIFGTNSAAQSFASTTLLPAGMYDITATVYNAVDNSILATSAIEKQQDIINTSPPHLHYPTDGDSILVLAPDLQWIPPVPKTSEMLYELHLVEVTNGEDPYYAIRHNPFMVDASRLTEEQLLYPEYAPSLEYGHTYAWQVLVYIGQQQVGQTEVWPFTPVRHIYNPDSISKKYPEANNSYWVLSGRLDGSYYKAYGKVKVSLVNKSIDTVLQYKITNLSNPKSHIADLPKIHLHRGLNNIDIPVSDHSGFVEDNQYLLSIALSDGSKYRVRFIYHNDN